METPTTRREGWHTWLRSWWTTAVLAAVHLGLVLRLFRVAWQYPRYLIAGQGGDPIQMAWFLGWVPRALRHGDNPLITNHLNAPAGGINLMWNASAPFLGLMLSPITHVYGVVAAYNVALTAAFIVNGIVAHRLLLRLVSAPWISAVGATAYAFCPAVIAQSVGHLNLTFAFFPPAVLLLAHEAFIRRVWSNRRLGLVAGTTAAVQFLIGEDQLVMTLLGAALAMALWGLVSDDRRRDWDRLLSVLPAASWALGTGAVMLAFPLWTAFFQRGYFTDAVHPPGTYANDVLSVITPHPLTQWIAPSSIAHWSRKFREGPSEWNLYFGLPVVALLPVLFVRRFRDLLTRWLLLCAAMFVVLSLGAAPLWRGRKLPVLMPWRIVHSLPVISNLLPSRFGLLAFLAIVAAGTLALRDAWDGSAVRRIAAGSLTAVCLVPWLMPPRLYVANFPVPTFFRYDIQKLIPSGSTVLVAPIAEQFEVAPMLWQATARYRFKMPGGYFNAADRSRGLDRTPDVSPAVEAVWGITGGAPVAKFTTPDRLGQIRSDLAAMNASFVVVGPSPHESQHVELFTAALGSPGTAQGSVHWWRVPVTERPVTLSWGRGFFGNDFGGGNPPYRWSRRDSELVLRNPSDRPREVVFSGNFVSHAEGGKGRLSVMWRAATGSRESSQPIGFGGPQQVRITVPPGVLRVRFRSDIGRVRDIDPRDLRWVIIAPVLTAVT